MKRKTTGELQVFKEIWKERLHVSVISDRPLKFFHPSHFMHVLPKGKYPKFRLYKKNIQLGYMDEHHIWDSPHKRAEVQGDPRWQKLFELEQELLKEYPKED